MPQNVLAGSWCAGMQHSFRSLRWPLSFKILRWSQIYSFLSYLYHVSSYFISLSDCYCLASGIIHEAHHHTVTSSLLLRSYSSVKIIPSSFYSLSPSPIFFLQCETQNFTHSKTRYKMCYTKAAGLLKYVCLSPGDISCNIGNIQWQYSVSQLVS